MSKSNEKLHFLRLVRDSKEILFGAFSDKLTRNMKVDEWKKITSECQSMGIVSAQKDYIYVRNVFWSNIKRAALSKRDNASATGAAGGKHQKLTSVDELVFDIIGNDSPIIDGIGVADIIDVENQECTIIDEISSEGITAANAAAEVIEVATTSTKETTTKSNVLSYKEFSAQKRKQEQIDDMADRQLKKSKIKLQIEYLELQNYRTKLEILSLEKSLDLPASKYSTSIQENVNSTN